MKIRVSSIQGCLIGLFAILSSLATILIPVTLVRQILMILLIALAFYKIIKVPMRRESLSYFALVIIMLGYLFINSGWSLTDTLLYVVALVTCISSERDFGWVKSALKIAQTGYLFYAVATVFLYFNRNIYMSYVVPLFPNTASRLINWYNSGYMAGLTNHYSTNAMLLAVGVIVFGTRYLALAQKNSTRNKCENRRNLLLTLFFVACLLLTAKRAHILFTGVALYCVYCFSLGKQRVSNKILKSVGIVFVVLIVGNIILSLVPAFSGFITRFQDTLDSGDVSMGRYTLWEYAIDAFRRNWLLGIGWKNFAEKISLAYNGLKVYDTHNIYLQLLAETGIVGTGIYFAWFGSFLYNSIKLYKYSVSSGDYISKQLLAFSLGFQVFFLLYGITGNPLYNDEMYIPYYMSCAITLYYRSNKAKFTKGQQVS